jgi:hypothetical protein
MRGWIRRAVRQVFLIDLIAGRACEAQAGINPDGRRRKDNSLAILAIFIANPGLSAANAEVASPATRTMAVWVVLNIGKSPGKGGGRAGFLEPV